MLIIKYYMIHHHEIDPISCKKRNNNEFPKQ